MEALIRSDLDTAGILMIPSPEFLLSLIRSRLVDLSVLGEEGTENASVKRGLVLTLRFLQARERAGREELQQQLEQLKTILERFEGDGFASADQARELRRRVESLDQRQEDLFGCETELDNLMLELERLIAARAMAGSFPTEAIRNLASFNAMQLERAVVVDDTDLDERRDRRWKPLRAGPVQAYLRERLQDPTLSVTDFMPLAGGFGKETVLLTVQGDQLKGDLVIRRDRAVNLLENDCHLVHQEYSVLQAVRARGFPTPNVLWLERGHALLPGADLIVMERVQGVIGGSVFGSENALDASVADVLGEIVARLHTMPAMRELGNLTQAISERHWNMPLHECVREYIENYFELMLNSDHMAALGVVAQFAWLLRNIPALEGRPCLLHGDIGLHNMLFNDGRLQALLDWEYAHIGDPAEDLAYMRNTMGRSLDWNRFMASYVSNGGERIDERRLRFFQIWGQVRNSAAAVIAFGKFVNHSHVDPVMMLIPYEYSARYLREAQRMIDGWHT
jgi:aminoglycoside phosphotransferase (APT) family kinase protein